MDEDSIPVYIKIAEKVLHLSRLGMTHTNIAERLGVNVQMAKRANHWGKAHREKRKSPPHL